MIGLPALRIQLATIAQSYRPIAALAYVIDTRPPRSLEEVERLLTEHSADVDLALAHVRNMRGYQERHGAHPPPTCTCSPGHPPHHTCPTHGEQHAAA